jgi:hypothetical protein
MACNCVTSRRVLDSGEETATIEKATYMEVGARVVDSDNLARIVDAVSDGAMYEAAANS